jgi:hypothetical protein
MNSLCSFPKLITMLFLVIELLHFIDLFFARAIAIQIPFNYLQNAGKSYIFIITVNIWMI